MKLLQAFFMAVAKWSSLAIFAVLAIFFCPFRLCAVCTSSSLGTGQVKPGFSDLRINSGRKPSLQNTDRNQVVRDQGIFLPTISLNLLRVGNFVHKPPAITEFYLSWPGQPKRV